MASSIYNNVQILALFEYNVHTYFVYKFKLKSFYYTDLRKYCYRGFNTLTNGDVLYAYKIYIITFIY